MCQDCVNDSQQELEWTLLGKLGLDICYSCVTTFWRDHALKPRLEKIAYEALNTVREQLEVEIYTLKETVWAQ
jgi:hypothetical protein